MVGLFYVRVTCTKRAGRLHRLSEGRPGRYPRQPGQGGNAAAVTSLYWVRTRPSTFSRLNFIIFLRRNHSASRSYALM